MNFALCPVGTRRIEDSGTVEYIGETNGIVLR